MRDFRRAFNAAGGGGDGEEEVGANYRIFCALEINQRVHYTLAQIVIMSSTIHNFMLTTRVEIPWIRYCGGKVTDGHRFSELNIKEIPFYFLRRQKQGVAMFWEGK